MTDRTSARRRRLRGLAAALLVPFCLVASVDLHGVLEATGHGFADETAEPCHPGAGNHTERAPAKKAPCPACLLRSGVRGASLPGSLGLEAPAVAPLPAPAARGAVADSPRPLPLSRGPPRG